MSDEIARLVQVMDQLREKCPWDREQSHQSLLTYLIEETYELVDSIESGDVDAMREELGDLLLQVVFHARIASETSQFTIDDVARGISEKLISRHPHVFGDVEATSAEEVERNWEALKAQEKKRSSIVEGIPLSQPALSWTSAVLSRAAKSENKVSMDFAPIEQPTVIDAESIGALLLAVVQLATSAGIDPELALRGAGRALIEQVKGEQGSR